MGLEQTKTDSQRIADLENELYILKNEVSVIFDMVTSHLDAQIETIQQDMEAEKKNYGNLLSIQKNIQESLARITRHMDKASMVLNGAADE